MRRACRLTNTHLLLSLPLGRWFLACIKLDRSLEITFTAILFAEDTVGASWLVSCTKNLPTSLQPRTARLSPISKSELVAVERISVLTVCRVKPAPLFLFILPLGRLYIGKYHIAIYCTNISMSIASSFHRSAHFLFSLDWGWSTCSGWSSVWDMSEEDAHFVSLDD